MFPTLCILGRQPALGVAELESLFGADNVQPFGESALLNIPAKDVPFARLGGTMKLCKVLTPLPTQAWPELVKYISAELPKHVCCLPEGKIKLGISVYDLPVDVRKINTSGLELKKVIKNAGRSSIRIVPNKTKELNSAQVLHNNLTGPLGYELILIKYGQQTILAQTIEVQDIEAYASRDQNRPMRDTYVGMLPPKLAQIIINLARPETGETVLDPFCGTGVIPQEALLMGYGAYGTDLEPRMIEYSESNLKWLKERYQFSGNLHLEVGDATNHQWGSPFQKVAAETYLGRPFTSLPDSQTLNQVMRDVDTIHKKFLQNMTTQTKPGFRVCLAVPAWKTRDGFKHLPVLDRLEELGYTRTSFAHAKNDDLIYHREGQIVARELVTITRK